MTEDRGDTEVKEEPTAAVGVEGWSSADGTQVRGGSRVKTHQGGEPVLILHIHYLLVC